MIHHIDIQHVSNESIPLSDDELTQLSNLALRERLQATELTIRLVDAEEMIHLNNTYRQQNKTTNVLSFPSSIPQEIQLDFPFIGDVIICPEVLAKESVEQNKTLQEHWSLIVIHGVLHLLGYDHIKDDEAEVMQAIEIKLLAEMGYSNPYDRG